ncbi:hypothetical protein O6H91_06G058200 [Diphasiastrum complanatum]|uniref:Uncharacterized protein n=1 Tax=Diphasiastrum complanatum TaxID=34168 RepID=A0ACC2DEC5_DIPCM|nr:hypothetical protein O6H91_06G058200 [Diphasiastrum complanatum]
MKATDASWPLFTHADDTSRLKTKSTLNRLHHLRWQTRTRSVAPENTPSDSGVCMSDHVGYIQPFFQTSFGSCEQEEAGAYEIWLSKENSAVSWKGDGGDITAHSENVNPSKIAMGEKPLPNGDFYAGSWHGNFPEGTGKYLWSDGCMYEGEWGRGKKMGKGRISWPSGATYEGDFMCGCMHGAGTYTGVDGTTYRGDWIMNVKHGYGRKRYANGDVYEGSWKEGVQEGSGRYCWANGNDYVGDWKGGLMTGKGVLRWAIWDNFEGQWLEGLEHGHGVYTWADGSCYVGTWTKGQKDGKGTFFPAGRNHSGSRLLCNQAHSIEESNVSGDERLVMCTPCRSGYASSSDFDSHLTLSPQRTSSISSSEKICLDELERSGYFENAMERMVDRDNVNTDLSAEESMLDGFTAYVVEREYVQGVLINEIVKECLSTTDLNSARKPQCWQLKECERPGETIIKGHRSYDLMLNLQLGIRYTVGKITPFPKREIGPVDFGPYARICMKFPRTGSALTPPHHSGDFTCKDYCPLVFRWHLREMFRIDAADYMLSVCGSDALRELSSPGKSGSVFYLSHDDRFMIKTMRKSEVTVLLRMLSNYYNHVQTSANTLITKFFGLHQIKPYGGRKVRFVVMGNMFCTELHIHRRYDLKGSSQGRSTDKVEIDENTTLKDLDLDFVFHLEPSWREALLKQIECDCHFLEMEHIVDYSLLLGLHFRAPQYPAIFSPMTSKEPDLPLFDGSFKRTSDFADLEEDCLEKRGLVLVSHSSGDDLSMAGPHVRGSPLKAGGVGGEEVDLLLPGTARLRIQLGVNMPARADRRLPRRECGQLEDEFYSEVYDVVLYLGIIDILQEYDISKRVEHAYKSLQFDPLSISAVEPRLYAKRFQDFIQSVFPAS